MPKLTTGLVEQVAARKIYEAREIQQAAVCNVPMSTVIAQLAAAPNHIPAGSAAVHALAESEVLYLQQLNFTKLMQYICKYFDLNLSNNSGSKKVTTSSSSSSPTTVVGASECSIVHATELVGLLPFPLKECPSLVNYASLQSRVVLRIFCAVAIRPVITLYDLEQEICVTEGVAAYAELGLGLSIINLEVTQRLFKFTPSRMAPITSEGFLSFLQFSPDANELLHSNANASALVEAFAKSVGLKRGRFCGIHVQNLPWLKGYIATETTRTEKFFQNRFRWEDCRLEALVPGYQELLGRIDSALQAALVQRELEEREGGEGNSNSGDGIIVALPVSIQNCLANSRGSGAGSWRLLLTNKSERSGASSSVVNSSTLEEAMSSVKPSTFPSQKQSLVKTSGVLTASAMAVIPSLTTRKKKTSAFVEGEVAVSLKSVSSGGSASCAITPVMTAEGLLSTLTNNATTVPPEVASVQLVSNRITTLQKSGHVTTDTLVTALAQCVVHLREALTATQFQGMMMARSGGATSATFTNDDSLPVESISNSSSQRVLQHLSTLKALVRSKPSSLGSSSSSTSFFESYTTEFNAMATTLNEMIASSPETGSDQDFQSVLAIIKQSAILVLCDETVCCAMDAPVFFPSVGLSSVPQMQLLSSRFRVLHPMMFHRAGGGATSHSGGNASLLPFCKSNLGICEGFRLRAQQLKGEGAAVVLGVAEKELLQVLGQFAAVFGQGGEQRPCSSEIAFSQRLIVVLGQSWRHARTLGSNDAVAEEILTCLQRVPWMVSSQSALCPPTELFNLCNANTEVFGSLVSYLSDQPPVTTDEQQPHRLNYKLDFLKVLGVHMAPTVSLVCEKLEKMGGSAQQHVPIAQLQPLYSFLARAVSISRSRSDDDSEVRWWIQRLKEKPIIYSPPSASGTGSGGFFRPIQLFYTLPASLKDYSQHFLPLDRVYSSPAIKTLFLEHFQVAEFPTMSSFWTSMGALASQWRSPNAVETQQLQTATEALLEYIHSSSETVFFENAMRRRAVFPTSFGWKSLNDVVFFGTERIVKMFSSVVNVVRFDNASPSFTTFLAQIGFRSLEVEMHQEVVYDSVSTRSSARLHAQLSDCLPFIQRFLKHSYPDLYNDVVLVVQERVKQLRVIVCTNPRLCTTLPGGGKTASALHQSRSIKTKYLASLNSLFVEHNSVVTSAVAASAALLFIPKEHIVSLPSSEVGAIASNVSLLLSSLLPVEGGEAERVAICHDRGWVLDSPQSIGEHYWEMSSAPGENFRSVFPPGTDALMMKIAPIQEARVGMQGFTHAAEQEIQIDGDTTTTNCDDEPGDFEKKRQLKRKYSEFMDQGTARQEVVSVDSATSNSLTTRVSNRAKEWNIVVENAALPSQLSFSTSNFDLKQQQIVAPSVPLQSALTSNEQVDSVSYSRIGEKFVYDTLCRELPSNQRLVWLNETVESGEPYDILQYIDTRQGTKQIVRYIEVKSSRTDDKRSFEMTLREFLMSAKHGRSYVVYRVFNAGNANAKSLRLEKLEDPIRLWYSGRLIADGGVRMTVT